METISRARRPWETGAAERLETPYAVLAAEVIRMAVKDYVKAVRRQIRYATGENDSTAYEIQRLEQFFRSGGILGKKRIFDIRNGQTDDLCFLFGQHPGGIARNKIQLFNGCIDLFSRLLADVCISVQHPGYS